MTLMIELYFPQSMQASDVLLFGQEITLFVLNLVISNLLNI